MRVAECFAFIAGKFDAVVPFSRLCNATLGEFHYNVHWRTIGDVASDVGTHPIAVLQSSIDISVNFNGAVYVQSVAENDLFAGRVDTQ